MAPDLQRLSARLATLEARVDLLERGAARVVPLATPRSTGAPGVEAPAGSAAETAALAGRMALGLGGAFVFRSATQAGVLTSRLGVVLGFAYGLAWLVAADRAAARGRVRDAIADAVLAALIGFPLVWEATARFQFLGPLHAWAAAAVIASGYGIVAVRRRMPAFLWPVVVGMPPLCFALSLATGVYPPWLALLLACATALQWTSARRGGFRPAATTALVLFDLSLALLTGMTLVATPLVLEHALVPWQVISIQTATFVLASATLLLRSARRRRMRGREAWQAAAATVLGLGGAWIVGHRTGASTLPAGAAALVVGAAACVLALRMARPATLGIPGMAVVILGMGTVLHGTPFLVCLCALALGAAVAARTGRGGAVGAWLALQAALAGILVLALSGALGFGLRALAGPPRSLPWTEAALALAAGLACAAAVRPGDGRALASARSGLLGALLVVLVGLGAAALAPLLPPLLRPSLRTGLIVAAALGSAWTAPVLVYPILVAGGFKILADEVQGRDPTMLVISLSLYGAALLLAPRAVRRSAARLRGRGVGVSS
ncbi:MAG TPA: hypothetical protein VFV75_00855 [Candidatus Polarisedimenticolaceae bacterium]|nr:hypothetical protein [Candidatus Polarisedimenticolaceae bacterium]